MIAEDYLMLALVLVGTVVLVERPLGQPFHRILLTGGWSFAAMIVMFDHHWYELGAACFFVFALALIFFVRAVEGQVETRVRGGLPYREVDQDEAGSV